MAASIVYSLFSDTNPVTTTLATAPTAGNLLVFVGGARSDAMTSPPPVFTPPAGYTKVAEISSMEQHSAFVSFKVADGTEGTTPLEWTADIAVTAEYCGHIEIAESGVSDWESIASSVAGSNTSNVSSIATGSTGTLSSDVGAAIIVGTSRTGSEGLSTNLGTSLHEVDAGAANFITAWLDLTSTTALNATISESGGSSRMGAAIVAFADAAAAPTTVTGTATGTVSASGSATATVAEAATTGTAAGTVSVSGSATASAAATATEVEFIGVGAQDVSNVAEEVITGAYPAAYTAVENDLAVVIAVGKHNAGSSDPITISGYTQIGTSFREIGSFDLQVTVLAKLLTASEAAPTWTVTTPYSSSGASVSLTTAIFRNVNTSQITDLAAVVSDAAAATTFTPTGLTTLNDGAMVLSVVGTSDDNAVVLDSGNEQGFTGQATGGSYDTTRGSNHAIGLATKLVDPAAAVTAPTWEQLDNIGTGAWAAVTVALRSTSGESPTTVTGTAAGAVAASGAATGTITEAVTAGTASGTVAVAGSATAGLPAVRNLKCGTADVDAVYIGSTLVDAIYHGSTQVF